MVVNSWSKSMNPTPNMLPGLLAQGSECAVVDRPRPVHGASAAGEGRVGRLHVEICVMIIEPGRSQPEAVAWADEGADGHRLGLSPVAVIHNEGCREGHHSPSLQSDVDGRRKETCQSFLGLRNLRCIARTAREGDHVTDIRRGWAASPVQFVVVGTAKGFG